ncbi:hypothetical protein K7X08_011443 [Anisodus acutangulus]|uniref:Uncharacterized protein n=1 Tax=Anisodus acutangulus TaxID=402998 RepID=A0A9Q1MJJ4_9SOLA|nr:hypothetical protein K7X08_011443 [Anisodus acutangulus]
MVLTSGKVVALAEGEEEDVVELDGEKDGAVVVHEDPKVMKDVSNENIDNTVHEMHSVVHDTVTVHDKVEERQLVEVVVPVDGVIAEKSLNPNAKVFTPSKKRQSPAKTKEWVQKTFAKPVEDVIALNQQCMEVPSTTFATETGGERLLWSEQFEEDVEDGEIRGDAADIEETNVDSLTSSQEVVAMFAKTIEDVESADEANAIAEGIAKSLAVVKPTDVNVRAENIRETNAGHGNEINNTVSIGAEIQGTYKNNLVWCNAMDNSTKASQEDDKIPTDHEVDSIGSIQKQNEIHEFEMVAGLVSNSVTPSTVVHKKQHIKKSGVETKNSAKKYDYMVNKSRGKENSIEQQQTKQNAGVKHQLSHPNLSNKKQTQGALVQKNNANLQVDLPRDEQSKIDLDEESTARTLKIKQGRQTHLPADRKSPGKDKEEAS